MPLLLTGFVALEIWLLVVLGRSIGVGSIFALVVGSGIAGSWIARRAGRRALAGWQQASMAGTVPAAALATSAMLVVAGVLLMIPGVLSDVAALLLLLPPVRRSLGVRVRHAFEDRLRAKVGGVTQGADVSPGRIIDVDPADVREAKP